MPGVAQQGIAAPVDVPADTPMPGRSPASFGADIGAGVEQLGGQLEQDNVRAKDVAARRQYQVDASAAGVATAQAQSDVSQQVDAIRQEAAPGAAGHVEAVSKAIDDRSAQVLAGIANPLLRSQFGEDLARFKAQKIDEESAWASGQRVAYQVTNVKQTGDTLANLSFSKPDPGTFATGLKTLATTIGNQHLSADEGAKLLHDQAQGIAEARARGLTNADPAQALTWLRSDEAGSYIPADRRAVLIDEAQTALRVQDADQRRQVAQQAAAVRVDAQALETRIGRGDMPSDAEVQSIVGRAQALHGADPGLASTLDALRFDQTKLKYSRLTDKWTTAEWDQAINPLAAKVAQNKASDDEQVELKVLQDLRPAKEARIANDPDGVSASTGIVPPQVDLDNPDPRAIAARTSWAQSFAKTYGKIEPPYLNPQQLAEVRGRAAQGPVAQLELAQQLKQTWGEAAPSIVRQVGGPASSNMKIMLGLDPAIAQRYSRGAEALDKKAVDFGPNDDAARQLFGTYARGIPGDLQPALFDAARKITAGWMMEQGFTKPPANFNQVFGDALQYAGGRTGKVGDFNAPGGLAELNGRYAWLPSDMTSNDFLGRIARARPQDWVNAAVDARGNPVKSVPHYIGPDGKPKPYTNGDALRFNKGTLQTLDTGLYHLADPLGHTVVDERGRPWTFDVRRLPR